MPPIVYACKETFVSQHDGTRWLQGCEISAWDYDHLPIDDQQHFEIICKETGNTIGCP